MKCLGSMQIEMKSIQCVREEVENIIENGICEKLITQADADTVAKIFDEFASSHPDHVFFSPKERREAITTAEEKLWQSLQPILDKAQSIQPITTEQAAEILRSAREDNPLHVSDFTSEDLEKLKVLAPEEYKMLK